MFLYLCVVAQIRTFYNIFGLNRKMIISLSLCGGTKKNIIAMYLAYIWRCLFLYYSVVAQRRTFLQYIWVKYEDVYFCILVLWHKDVQFYTISGVSIRFFISMCLCGCTNTCNLAIYLESMLGCLNVCTLNTHRSVKERICSSEQTYVFLRKIRLWSHIGLFN